MPWKVQKPAACPASAPWGVVNADTGALVPGGCHATKAEAEAHKRALYANVPDVQAARLARVRTVP